MSLRLMSLRSFAAVTAAFAGLLISGAALASYTTGSVNLRLGPGSGYDVITTMPPGAYIVVNRCVPGWCQVNYSGVGGWMATAYIAGGNYPPRYAYPVAPYPQPYQHRPRLYPDYPEPFPDYPPLPPGPPPPFYPPPGGFGYYQGPGFGLYLRGGGGPGWRSH
jgi:hypothetical protein